MTDKQILETISRYEVAKEFLEAHDYVKEIVEKLDQVQTILSRFDSLQELVTILDMFKKQQYILKEYFTLEEASIYTGVPEKTLRYYAYRHKLPYYSPFREMMFKKQDIIKCIERAHKRSEQEIKEFAQNYCETHSFMPKTRPKKKPTSPNK